MEAMLTRHTERVHHALIASINVKTIPEMLKRLIPKEINPAFIGLLYQNAKDKYNKVLKLSEKEKDILSNLGTDGFDKCDTPLLYKLIKHFNFVGTPTKGWGSLNNELQNVGDVVDAIIRLRDEIVKNATKDFKNLVNELTEIAKVVDKLLSTDNKFENAVKLAAMDEFNEGYFEKCHVAVQLVTKEEGNVANCASGDTLFEEDEENCFDADIFTNFLHTKIELSPDFFKKAGKHEVKQIKESTDEICKTGATSRRGERQQSKDGTPIGQVSSFDMSDVSNESLKLKKTRKRKWTTSEAAVDYPSSSTIYIPT